MKDFWTGFEKQSGFTSTVYPYAAGALLGAVPYGIIGMGMSEKESLKGKLKDGLIGAAVGGVLGAGTAALYKNIGSRSKGYSYRGTRYTPYGKEHLERSLSNIGATGKEKTKAEVRKKFRDAAFKSHPNRGGDEEVMKGLNSSWEVIKNDPWFHKLAFNVLKGIASKGRHSPPPIPGPRMMHGTSSAIPGQGAMVMGQQGLKKAPQSIKSQGAGSMPVP